MADLYSDMHTICAMYDQPSVGAEEVNDAGRGFEQNDIYGGQNVACDRNAACMLSVSLIFNMHAS